MEEITIEDYTRLKKKQDIVNEKSQRFEVEKQFKLEQLKKILNQYGVKNVVEFKKLCDEELKQSQKLYKMANEALDKASVKLAEADNILHS